MKADHLKQLLTETVKILLKDVVKYHNALAVEGLLGITLDNKDVFLVYVNETCTGVSGDTATNGDICCDVNASDRQLISIDEKVGDTMPLVIMSCWSEAPTQNVDFGSVQGETASTSR